MTLVFDAEPLLAFAFDESGAENVAARLDDVYDGERRGYVTTINLAEFRYIAMRRTSAERADAHIDDLQSIGLQTIDTDGLWRLASELKAVYRPSLADAYAVAAASRMDADRGDVTLLVGADDDYGAFEETEYDRLIERVRDEPG